MGGKLQQVRALAIKASGPMTPLGRAIFGVGLVAWLCAVLFGWREFAVIAGAALLGTVIGLAFTFGRTEIEVRTVLAPKRVVAGERAVAEFTVTNSAPRRMLPVRLEVPIGPAYANVNVPSLSSGEMFEEMIVIPAVRRSVIGIGPTKSVRGDPLGLMRREIQWTDMEELFIHPATNELAGLSSGWMRDLEGRPTDNRSPSDVAFHTLREYVPGDDRRHIHWRTSARINKLMVRQFIDNRRSHLGLVLDTNPGNFADADEFELAVSMVGSLGLRALRDGQETSCVAGAKGVTSHTGQSLLDGLARVELGVPTISIQETAMRAAPQMTAASVVVIVTGSGLPPGDLQLAGQRFGLDAQIVGLVADLSQPPAFRQGGGLLQLQADSLTSFARLMVGVTH